MALKCIVPKCRVSVNGITGFDELQRFRKHLVKMHPEIGPLTMERVMELRLMAEKAQELTQEKFLEWLAED
jgi:hypothetical protein